MTSAGAPSGRSAERRPATARKPGSRVAHQALRERPAVLADDLDRGVGVEVALDVPDTGGEQRATLRDQRAPRAVVDDDPPAGTDRERDPELAARQALRVRLHDRADRTSRPARPRTHPGLVGRRRSPPGSPDHDAILAAASLLAMPPLPRSDPVPPATASSASSTAAISSISDASASRRGSAVNRPAVSVSSTSSSARTMFATSAAIRSLSP